MGGGEESPCSDRLFHDRRESALSAAANERDNFHSVLSTNHSSASVRFDRFAFVRFAGRNSVKMSARFEEVDQKLAFVWCAAYCI